MNKYYDVKSLKELDKPIEIEIGKRKRMKPIDKVFFDLQELAKQYAVMAVHWQDYKPNYEYYKRCQRLINALIRGEWWIILNELERN